MDDYVKNARSEFQYQVTRQHHYMHSKAEKPDYGAKVQYVK